MLENLMGAQVMESAEDASVLEAMTDEDCAQLVAIMLEEALTDEELDEFVAECSSDTTIPVVEGYLMERSIVKLDRRAKKQKSYKLAVLQVAKEMNLPSFKKIVTLWKMERFLWNDMEKKCGPKAKTRMKSVKKKVDEAENKAMKKVAPKLTRSERRTAAAKSAKKAPSKLLNQTNTVMKSIEKKIK